MAKKHKSMLFQHIPVEAMFFLGDEKSAIAILEWMRLNGGRGESFRQIDSDGAATSQLSVLGGTKNSNLSTQIAYPSDWVVFEDGLFFAIGSDEFNERYSQLTYPKGK